MSNKKNLIIVLTAVGVLAAIAVALAVLLFLQKGSVGEQADQNALDAATSVDASSPIKMSEFVTEESSMGCPAFTFDYPEEWEAVDLTNSSGVKVQIKGEDSVDIIFEAFHTGGTIGDDLGNRVTIKEVAPADLAAGASQYVPGYQCMVADVYISGVKFDAMHSSSNIESSSNGVVYLAVVPDSWSGDWVDETGSGAYGFNHGVGCSYLFGYAESAVEDPEHSNYGPLAVGFYCKNANLLSDENREKVIATLSSLRVA